MGSLVMTPRRQYQGKWNAQRGLPRLEELDRAKDHTKSWFTVILPQRLSEARWPISPERCEDDFDRLTQRQLATSPTDSPYEEDD
jgi:hypothetical protein